jgi:transcriptional regulator with XRE-family HTH domain
MNRNAWVTKWRTTQGWSPQELAARAGLSVEALAIVEDGSPLDPAVAARIREAIQHARRNEASTLIDRACGSLSQRRLEAILGLSQGYLSRLANQHGNPSPILIALLQLLANDPRRIRELDRSRPAPPPQPTTAPPLGSLGRPSPAVPHLRTAYPASKPVT